MFAYLTYGLLHTKLSSPESCFNGPLTWSTNAFFTIQETVRKSQDVEFLKIYMP